MKNNPFGEEKADKSAQGWKALCLAVATLASPMVVAFVQLNYFFVSSEKIGPSIFSALASDPVLGNV
jgi:hypothetical protein